MACGMIGVPEPFNVSTGFEGEIENEPTEDKAERKVKDLVDYSPCP